MGRATGVLGGEASDEAETALRLPRRPRGHRILVLGRGLSASWDFLEPGEDLGIQI